MSALTRNLAGQAPAALPLEAFMLEYVEQAGGAWERIEPQVYDVLIERDPVRVAFDPEALPEHPGAQLATLGSPLMDALLGDARRMGEHTVLYAGGLNPHRHDLAGALFRAFTWPPKCQPRITKVRHCFFPQGSYRFVATFVSDQKEQSALELMLDLHSGREVRQGRRLFEQALLTPSPVEALPEAPHLSLEAGFEAACRQVARSISPLANQRRRELMERTGRQIERMKRYYERMKSELAQQPARGADAAAAAARRQARMDAIDRERTLRIAELEQKSALRVKLALSQVLVVHLPKLLIRIELNDSVKRVRELTIVFDLLTDMFEPAQLAEGGPRTFDLQSAMG